MIGDKDAFRKSWQKIVRRRALGPAASEISAVRSFRKVESEARNRRKIRTLLAKALFLKPPSCPVSDVVLQHMLHGAARQTLSPVQHFRDQDLPCSFDGAVGHSDD